MTIGMMSGLRRNFLYAHRPTVAGDHLLELVGFADALRGGPRERLLDDGNRGLEGRRVVDEAADEEVRRLGQLAGVGVDDGDAP